jgi:predicted nucleic acid-binding protein
MAVYLADKSALARGSTRETIRSVLEPLLVAGRIATCRIIDLELLFSAPSKQAYAQTADALQGMPRVLIDDAVFDRALEVQAALALASQHRAVPLPDLIIAACAELNGLVVLHYDADFDRIAKVTHQPTHWVVPQGSVS